ncbi:PNK3P-domain-containing protein [Agrocybe pediades]|nr:PNK3P-domain-containing protein [Agrocybe pediades]
MAEPARSSSSSSLKRKLPEGQAEASQPAQKATKIHPFFLKKTVDEEQKPKGSFQWLEPLGPAKSCLHGINLQPKASEKVAALDLDGTVITMTKMKPGIPAFAWWRSLVPDKLRELHRDGYSIVLISNQALQSNALKTWKEKIPQVGNALHDVPFRILAATQRDRYRKPMPGMWYELERIFSEEGVQIDKSKSFFVGDAAGRLYTQSKGDFASTDRKWALNLDIPFFTPEEFFLKLAPHTKYELPGFHPSSLPHLPLVTPSSSPIIPERQQKEVVVFVGYPSLGKTTFFRKYFEPYGYVHINQDTLKTREKCVKAVEEALKAGKSCVVDNTNPSLQVRSLYVDVAKANKAPARCFLFTGSLELAWHNNLYRAYNLPPTVAAKEAERTVLPFAALTKFRDAYAPPAAAEGFSEIKNVNWVFEGSEEEKKRWSMWLQIDGK